MGLRKHERIAVFERDGYFCRYCGIGYRDARTGEMVERVEIEQGWWTRHRTKGLLHVDHVIPRCKGGTDDIDNLVTACASCNLSKYDKERTPRPLTVPDVAG